MGVSLVKSWECAPVMCLVSGHMGCARCVDGMQPVSLDKRNPVIRATRVMVSDDTRAYVDVREHADWTVSAVVWRHPDACAGWARTYGGVVGSGRFADELEYRVQREAMFGTFVGVKSLR